MSTLAVIVTDCGSYTVEDMATPLRKPITSQFRRRSSSGGLVALLAALGVACAGSSLRAADATWNVTTSGSWVTDANWNPAAAPGSTSGTTNTDTATFGNIISGAQIVTVDANRNIFGINFSGNNSAYTLSGGNLLLTAGGTIQTSGGGSGHTDTVSAPISLQGNYSFTAGSTTATRLLVISGSVTSAATSGTTILTLNGSGTGNNTVSGIISNGTGSNAVGISKSGAGKWVLSGSNTLTGPVSISGGTLSVASDSNLGTAPGVATPGSILLSGGGILQVTANNAISANRGLTLGSGGGSLQFTHVNGGQYSGVITGFGSLTIDAAAVAGGQVTISNSLSDYSGGTTIVAGSRLAIDTSSVGPAGAPTSGPFGTGTITWNSAGIRTSSVASPRTIGNAITLQGNLTRYAGGSAAAGSRNLTFSGPVTITGGSRSIINDDNQSNQLIFSGAIGDGGNGYGLTISSATANTVQFSGNNTFTGGVAINSGSLLLGSGGALNSSAGSQNAVTFGAASTGRLTLNGNSVIISNLASNATAGTPVVQNASGTAATLTVGNSVNLSGTFAGVIQNGTGAGALSLTKAGNGTLTLSGSNSYTGATTVSAGTFLVSGSLNGTSSVAVGTGATLASGTGGGISTAASGNVGVSGFLAPGGSTAGAGAGTLTLSLGAGGKLDFGTGSTLSFGLGTASDLIAFNAAGDWLSGDGNAVLSLDTTLSGFSYANTYTIFQNVTTTGYDFASVTGYDTTNYLANVAQVGNDYVLSFAAVPEPGVAALFFGGIGVVSFFRRRHASASV